MYNRLYFTCLPLKIAMITPLNSHTPPDLTFWHLVHYIFSVLGNDPKIVNRTPFIARIQTTAYKIHYRGKQATLTSSKIKSSFKEECDRFVLFCLFLNEIWNPQLSIVLEKDAASCSSDNLPTTKHMCKQDFFFVFLSFRQTRLYLLFFLWGWGGGSVNIAADAEVEAATPLELVSTL